ncbi:LuxR C-terminal-related transcriptional regulator [Erythrobacter aureus]|uniref:LuxR C-terminal-related transcriptional regulator n=1 Tax=Erythrobacter aureus TaxID=2182384 RepID=UPI0013B46510|nr:LuxR C-terminal-related transcriptional regulator [Erythrobacter aureus]
MAGELDDAFRDRLIREAYEVVAAPEHLFDLQLRVAKAADKGSDAPRMLAPHIEQVGEIFDRVHFAEDSDFAGLSLGPSTEKHGFDTAIAFTLDNALRIVDGGQAHSWVPGETLPDFATGFDTERRQRLRQFVEGRDSRQSMILRIHRTPEDERGVPMVATVREREDQRLIDLRRLSLSWDDPVAAEFATAMGLSTAESELMRYLVEGRSLTDFAADRDRSIGTARNQLKATMRKLGVASQSELVALYAGFSETWRLGQMGPTGSLQSESATQPAAVLADGSEMPFERSGMPGGTPVLVLHGSIEGPFLTPDLEQRAKTEAFDLIIPWMPFYTQLDASEDVLTGVDDFAHRAGMLLDALGIERCVVLATSFSSAYGLAVRAHLGDRISGVVLTGSPIPMRDGRDTATRNPLWRAPLLLARTSPAFLQLLVRAVVRLSMRGETYRYFDRLLEKSPLDRETLRRPDVQAAVRRAFVSRPDRAARGMTMGLLLILQDWSRWLDAPGAPVRVLVGEEDTIHDFPTQLAHCSAHGFEAVGPIAGAGGFILFQRPGLVLDHLRQLSPAGGA